MIRHLTLLVALIGASSPTRPAEDAHSEPQYLLARRQVSQRLPATADYDLCLVGDQSTVSWVLGRRTGDYGWRPVVRGVTDFAAQGARVFGRADGGLFLVTASKECLEESVSFFPDRQAWTDALGAAGVNASTPLATPWAVAASTSRFELRPWEYHILRGVGGLTDEDWAAWVTCIAIAVSAVVGTAVRRVRPVLVVAATIGALAGCAGDTLVFEGPALGMIGTPICCAAAGLLGVWLGRFVTRLASKVGAAVPNGPQTEGKRRS